MFNFFLVSSGLIGNVYIQFISRASQISHYVPVGVGAFGAFLSVVSFLIHRRSRDLLDTAKAGLERQERKLFPGGGGCMISTPPRMWFNRHKYQFPITYGAFIAAGDAAMLISDHQRHISNFEAAPPLQHALSRLPWHKNPMAVWMLCAGRLSMRAVPALVPQHQT